MVDVKVLGWLEGSEGNIWLGYGWLAFTLGIYKNFKKSIRRKLRAYYKYVEGIYNSQNKIKINANEFYIPPKYT